MASSDGLTALMIACRENDSKTVEEILNSSDQQNSSSTPDKTGKVAMHYCAEHGDADLIKKVFESDPSLMDKRDEDGYTPLTFGVIGGNGPVVDFLLEKGADINNVDAEKHSLIHWATVCGHTDILSKLLRKGSLPSTPDLYGAHALHYATQTSTAPAPDLQASASTSTMVNGHVGGGGYLGTDGTEILKILLKHGANVNCTDYEERTPLLWAASCGNCAAVSALLEAGADKHSFDKDHLTALHCAASRGHGNVIRTICKTTADVQINARDRNGSSPLFYAAALGHADAVRALLENGAMADLQDKKLRTAAHCAAAKGQVGTLKLLFLHGASFALENYRGDLAIHEAVQAGSQELIEWMLSIAPTYTNATNHDGRTPLHLAAALGHLQTSQLLVEKGAHKDALMLSKSACVTALDLAEEKGHQPVVDYLRGIDAKRCSELTPQSIVVEFKKHMATRKLAVSKHPDEVKLDEQHQQGQGATAEGGEDRGDGAGERKEGVVKKAKKTKKSHKHTKVTNGEADEQKPAGEGDGVDENGGAQADEEPSVLVKLNGAVEEGNPVKEKKRSKKGAKDKEADKKNKKSNRNEALDSTRTSAGVSEIGSADEDAEEEEAEGTEGKKSKGKNSKRTPSTDENNPNGTSADGRLAEGFRTGSADGGHNKKHSQDGSDVMSEPGGHSRHVQIHRNGKGASASDASSSVAGGPRGSSGGNARNGHQHTNRPVQAIDRYRTDWETSLRSSVHRYAEEKRIFQELANLKRLQIQYSNVQEEVVVRRLMDDFLRGYNVRAGDFQVGTFNSWEKFLYDQLKILYRKEKESLLQTYESKVRNQTSLFEQKQAASIGGARRRGVEDRVDRLSRTYGIAPIPMQYSPRLYKASFMSSDIR